MIREKPMKFFKKINCKKRITALILAVIAAFAVAAGAVRNESIYAFSQNKTARKLPIYSVERSDKKIAISFDCAWGNEHTETLLNVMDEYGVKCTFFCVSFWAEKYPDDLKEIIARGHEAGTHSKTHPKMSKLSEKEITDELEYSCRVIKDITGIKPVLFRPPFGDYDDLLIETAQKLSLYTIQWDVDSLDWKDLSANDIAKRVISKTKSGSIILCHNNGKHTAESLPLIFATLKAKGYEFVKISDLIYKEGYKIDVNGRQIKNE